MMLFFPRSDCCNSKGGTTSSTTIPPTTTTTATTTTTTARPSYPRCGERLDFEIGGTIVGGTEVEENAYPLWPFFSILIKMNLEWMS